MSQDVANTARCRHCDKTYEEHEDTEVFVEPDLLPIVWRRDDPMAPYYREIRSLRLKVGQLSTTIEIQGFRIRDLFEKIKHGDEAHQQWLKDAIARHFAEQNTTQESK